MKRYWLLAAFGCACLSFAAVWMGGLNQDEGWYLYAANLVHEGQQVYRDFAFTQGPVMPNVYAAFTWIWAKWGLLGARAFTLVLGLVGIFFAAWTAKRLVEGNRKEEIGNRKEEIGNRGEGLGNRRGNVAAVLVAMLLGCNLYHLYYLAIPKTYALASVFVAMGMWLVICGGRGATRPTEEVKSKSEKVKSAACYFLGGVLLGLAAGVRISLGAILPVVGVALMVKGIGNRAKGISVEGFSWLWFGVGGVVGLGLSYGGVLFDAGTMKGFLAAQQYHAARGGFDLTWVIGSLSRLVRWYLPVFIVLGLGVFGKGKVKSKSEKVRNGSAFVVLLSFLAVFVVQMAAPFPYEDYQVPIMGLLAVYAVVNFVDGGQRSKVKGQTEEGKIPLSDLSPLTSNLQPLLVLGLTFASSFGSPLLEKWMTNGQDRFWSLKKEKCELAQLRDAAKRIEEIDPNGKEIFTQDLYLAIETNRKVPKGLEMGPFSILTDAEWRKLIASAPCKVAAVSGYTFAIEPPKCNERPLEQQLEYLRLMKENYEAVDRIADFGQNATTLLLLKRADEVEKIGGGGQRNLATPSISAGRSPHLRGNTDSASHQRVEK